MRLDTRNGYIYKRNTMGVIIKVLVDMGFVYLGVTGN